MKSIWVPVSGAVASQRKVETIANNVANANTPGFKKDQLVFKEYLTALEKGVEDIHIPRKEFAPKDFYHTEGGQNAYVKAEANFTNFSQGQLEPTQNPLDLALHGKGLFEVLTPNGIRFTRKGNFSLNSEGHLVTSEGSFVLSKTNPENPAAPEARKIKVDTTRALTVGKDGNLFQGNERIGQLSLLEFFDTSALRKEGNTYFYAPEQQNIKPDVTETMVHQGFIEGSNVNVVEEMAELIKANRHFESLQRAIKTYDSMSNKLINEASKF